MNFKKYHVSRNIVAAEANRTNPIGGLSAVWEKDSSYMVINGKATGGESYRFATIELDAGTYTLSITGLDETGWDKTGFYLSGVDTVRVQGVRTYTITEPVSARLQFVVQPSEISYENRKVTIMLNTGSTPQPYEPYSSEVWHDTTHYIHNTSTDTITTLPAVIYPNDTSVTVGIKGNTVQNGTPTPTTPIQPQECGERTGNLVPPSWASDFVSRVTNNPKPYIEGNIINVYASNGYGNYDTQYLFSTSWKTNTQYTVNLTYLRDSQYTIAPMLAFEYTDGTRNTFDNTINDGEWHNVYVTSAANKTIKNIQVWYTSGWIQLKIDKFCVYEGTEQKPFEPYGYKLDISSANTTTPVYLGEVETTRQIRKLMFDGTENWSTGTTHIFNLEITTYLRNANNKPFCTHYTGMNPVEVVSQLSNGETAFLLSSSGNNRFYIRDDSITTVADFKSYLAAQYAVGTPVTIWYVLATPTTGILNEPLRKIGSYSDRLTTSIPVTAGENTLDVQTTVQPSEVTANYQGWHPVQSVYERDNGQWD